MLCARAGAVVVVRFEQQLAHCNGFSVVTCPSCAATKMTSLMRWMWGAREAIGPLIWQRRFGLNSIGWPAWATELPFATICESWLDNQVGVHSEDTYGENHQT